MLALVAAIFSGSANSPSLSSAAGAEIAADTLPAGAPSQLQIYDPAAAAFNAQLNYDAMSLVAPLVFGDFLSTSSLRMTPSFAGPMGVTAAVDPGVSSELNQTFQEAILPAGGPAETEASDIGPSDWGIAGGFSADARGLPSSSSSLPAGKAPGGCPDSETARDLQTGSRFWGPQTRSALPAYFPKGVFSGRNIADPLGDLGPTGDRENLSSMGAAGSWCRPGPTPFDLTSPLEDRMVWLLFGLLAGGFMVFYLTRGIRLPA